jgi:hypothetical protein
LATSRSFLASGQLGSERVFRNADLSPSQMQMSTTPAKRLGDHAGPASMIVVNIVVILTRRLQCFAPPGRMVEHGRSALDKMVVVIQRAAALDDAEIGLADIESGKLLRLELPEWRGGEYTLQAIHKIDAPPGPAGWWLIERLVTPSDESDMPAQEIAKPVEGKGYR